MKNNKQPLLVPLENQRPRYNSRSAFDEEKELKKQPFAHMIFIYFELHVNQQSFNYQLLILPDDIFT